MYYNDLAPCSYFGAELADKLIAVGWLDNEHPYTEGNLNDDTLDKLFELLVKPWNPMLLMGYAECGLCKIDINDLTYNDKTIRVGNLNLFIPGEGFLYVMPSLAAHCILAHNYAPPQEFCDAVMRCPPMGSDDYYRAVVANGPQRYADLIKAKYLATE